MMEVEMKYQWVMLLFAVLIMSFLVYAQDNQENLVTDDFLGQKVSADQFLDKWINEYVKWIILPEEKDEFENLATVQEKMSFIEMFWLKRDPVPATFYNEFKEDYYQRLRFIYNNFGYSDTPGILTHRGMVYAVLGEPQYIDENFTIDGSDFRRGDRFSRRGIIWVYGPQGGVKIPAYYQILFLKFGTNRYEIVADYWGQKSSSDLILDSGAYGRQGYVPHRLEALLKDKKEWLVMNKDTEELKKKLKNEGYFSVANIEVACSLTDSDTPDIWKYAVCKIRYADMVFKVENGENIAELEGDLIIKTKDNSFKYSFPRTSLRLNDEELKGRFSDVLELKTGIDKAPESDKYDIYAEIRDQKSGVVYEMKKEDTDKK
jgi:GWxTD domain-containing protein